MSTGADCRFRETEPGRWTYWLQSWPYGEWPEGTTYGPFPSFAAAVRHLGDNHANPGGWTVTPLREGHVHEPDQWDPTFCEACGESLAPKKETSDAT